MTGKYYLTVIILLIFVLLAFIRRGKKRMGNIKFGGIFLAREWISSKRTALNPAI